MTAAFLCSLSGWQVVGVTAAVFFAGLRIGMILGAWMESKGGDL